MSENQSRHLPVRPNLDQLKHQAKDLLRALRREDRDAVAEFKQHHPDATGKLGTPEAIKLADAQLALARSYGAPNWPRLVQACQLVEAIWCDDVETVRRIVTQNPKLIRESTLITERNWGPPLSYAANLGRDEIIKFLHKFGALDLEYAMDRAILQSKITTAAMLYKLMGSPPAPDGALGGPAYTLSVSGTAFALEIGAPVRDREGRRIAPVDIVLETDSRKPSAKHEILEMYVKHG